MKVVVFLCVIAAAIALKCYTGTINSADKFDEKVADGTISNVTCSSNVTTCARTETNTTVVRACGACADGADCSACKADLCNGSATATAAALVLAAAYWLVQ